MYIKITSFAILMLSILAFEIAYKKDNDEKAVYGIELLVLAVFTLLIEYLSNKLSITQKTYIISGLCLFLAYYVIKIIIIYTKKNKEKLDKFNDIKEIVKDEPIKKQTRRKNKEEGRE